LMKFKLSKKQRLKNRNSRAHNPRFHKIPKKLRNQVTFQNLRRSSAIFKNQAIVTTNKFRLHQISMFKRRPTRRKVLGRDLQIK